MASPCELLALCLGIIGLVGASAATGLPMWRVTAFIQENIITMETRWEGLWMNCYRQANIRMQCKVYDSLLYLPPELQAARGLMCCAVALCGLGLLVSFPGLQSTACLPDQPRMKSLIIMVAGVMQVMAGICVIIPVSWTAHIIIQDFYNPLLLDAQRRELGEALYIGWVTAAVLVASGVVFLVCRSASESDESLFYRPVYATNSSTSSRVHPFVPTPSSLTSMPLLPNHNLYRQQSLSSTYSPVALTPTGQPVLYNAQQVPPSVPVLYSANMVPKPQTHLSTHGSGRLSTPRNSSHPSVLSAPPPPAHSGQLYAEDPHMTTTEQVPVGRDGFLGFMKVPVGRGGFLGFMKVPVGRGGLLGFMKVPVGRDGFLGFMKVSVGPDGFLGFMKMSVGRDGFLGFMKVPVGRGGFLGFMKVSVGRGGFLGFMKVPVGRGGFLGFMKVPVGRGGFLGFMKVSVGRSGFLGFMKVSVGRDGFLVL
ncbi:hypothetical protein NFI96_006224 [Prochilodus magdalenae]|nr:hypothetical protein NFI96_006224 [Prochilodus magdalenae]